LQIPVLSDLGEVQLNMKNHNHNKWDLIHLIKYHRLHYVLLVIFAFVIFIGFAVFFVEQKDPTGNIETIGDGIWWAFSTVASVGYGDRVPVTTLGRSLAILLMLVGIALFSIITANIASFFVEEDEEKELLEIKSRIINLENKIDKLLETQK